MKKLKYFKDKELKILKAINRVTFILDDFDTGKRKDVDNWNLCHDLQYRLRQRRYDNWMLFKDWHWIEYGYNIY